MIDKELTLLKVENQWLVSNKKKKTSGSEEKVEDMARELQELKLELRNGKEKVALFSAIQCAFSKSYFQVKNLADWKSQLAEKNKSLKEENNR